MRTRQETSGAAVAGAGCLALRLLRSTGSSLLANPLAFAVTGVSVWLLASLVIGLFRAQAAGAEWSLSGLLSCGTCILALGLLACLASGHIAVTWIAGWRANRS